MLIPFKLAIYATLSEHEAILSLLVYLQSVQLRQGCILITHRIIPWMNTPHNDELDTNTPFFTSSGWVPGCL
jgi:hypothetical protein